MNEDQYVRLVGEVHDLINREIDLVLASNDRAASYPKLLVMFRFFQYLRGEAFNDVRPPAFGQQQDFYRMENELQSKLDEVSKLIDPNDTRGQFLIKQELESLSENF
jgi:hypothetical protein